MPVRSELATAVQELTPRYSTALSPILPPGEELPGCPYSRRTQEALNARYTMAMLGASGKCVEKYRHAFIFVFH